MEEYIGSCCFCVWIVQNSKKIDLSSTTRSKRTEKMSCIFVFLGQAGNQVGNEFIKLLYGEYVICIRLMAK